MFDTKSGYTVSKRNRSAIACSGATGVHIRLALKDFAGEKKFKLWKSRPDCDCCKIEKDGSGFLLR